MPKPSRGRDHKVRTKGLDAGTPVTGPLITSIDCTDPDLKLEAESINL